LEITCPALASLNDAVSVAYNTQFGATKTVYKEFSSENPSTGAASVYPRLNMIPGLRQWVGDREAHNVSIATFMINNNLYELTIEIERTDIEDDKLSLLTPVALAMGQNAARLPDILTAVLLKAGHTTMIYDNQNMFDTAHPDYTSTGASTTASNYSSGSSPVWYLLDTSGPQRATIYQPRRPFVVIPQFSMTDPQVFATKTFRWGVDGRCNVGFGLWQYGYMSQQPLTIENIIAARTAMASFRRPDGTPLGIAMESSELKLVTGSSNYPNARALAEDPKVPNTLSNLYTTSTTVTDVPNVARNLFKALENPWLN
jgi:phage major head subunit gpT-like protein